MTDHALLPPALTPEEWLESRVMFRRPKPGKRGSGYNDDEGYGIEFTDYSNKQRLAAPDWAHVFDGSWSVVLDDSTRHKLGALALHGKPFGFTHSDVAMLRQRAKNERFAYGDAIADAHDLEGLADRIAALLPPENLR